MRRRILLFTLLAVWVTQIGVAGGQRQAQSRWGEPAAAEPRIVADGFLAPESVLYDPEQDVYLVSNVNGGLTAKDDNGFISRVSPDGKVLELRWIDGAASDVTLHAPKGMAIRHQILFVADIDTVRLFDRTTGKPGGQWPIAGATFLNDLGVAPDGTIYFTDSALSVEGGQPRAQGPGTVYRFEKEQQEPTPLARGESTGAPNGIVGTPEGPVWVTFLDNKVYRVRSKDAPPEVIASLPAGQLDGIVRLNDGSYVVSSWAGRAIYRVSANGAVRQIRGGLETPAGIEVDEKRGVVIVPQLSQNRLAIVPLQ